MTSKRKLAFVTGTRADFGKLKSLINIVAADDAYEVHVFVTGMHLLEKFGHTIDEVYAAGYQNIHGVSNSDFGYEMDNMLAVTIAKFSEFIKKVNPDLVVVHGDRVEALGTALSSALNNVLVAHVEGGELSGTVDGHIRHAVSKMSHAHFVANEEAQLRLLRMGEHPDSVFTIGSPDMDLMNEENLPSLEEAKTRYKIEFETYALALFHPVTTEVDQVKEHAEAFASALIGHDQSYVVIFPNNDLGHEDIINVYQEHLSGRKNIRMFPSLRFEYFLRLLKSAEFMIGNSSAGVREAPFFGVPAIDIGTRQAGRASGQMILHCDNSTEAILGAMSKVRDLPRGQQSATQHFGSGASDYHFKTIIDSPRFWNLNLQKKFWE